MTTKFSKKLIKECYYFIDCPDDCTSPTHGICVIGNCKCNPGFEGYNCAGRKYIDVSMWKKRLKHRVEVCGNKSLLWKKCKKKNKSVIFGTEPKSVGYFFDRELRLKVLKVCMLLPLFMFMFMFHHFTHRTLSGACGHYPYVIWSF